MPKQAASPAPEFEAQGKDEAKGNECVERGVGGQGLSHKASNLETNRYEGR